MDVNVAGCFGNIRLCRTTNTNARRLSLFLDSLHPNHRFANQQGSMRAEDIDDSSGAAMVAAATMAATVPWTTEYVASVNVDDTRQRIFYCFEYIKLGVLYICLLPYYAH